MLPGKLIFRVQMFSYRTKYKSFFNLLRIEQTHFLRFTITMWLVQENVQRNVNSNFGFSEVLFHYSICLILYS